MSTESRFAGLTFPDLRTAGQDRSDEQARARGHAAGYTAGLRAAEAEVNARIVRLEREHAAMLREGQERLDRAVGLLGAAARALNERTLPLLSESEGALTRAALELTEAIIGYELGDGEKSARSALDRALRLADPALVRSVRMHPDDMAILDDGVRMGAGVDFIADESLARGDAITHFPDGYLDARIGTALARAKSALLEEEYR